MPEKNDNVVVCTYLALIGVVVYASYKIVGLFSNNRDVATSGLEVAKQVGVWVAVIIIIGIVLVKTFKYRNSIKRWEQKELQEYLDRNSTEQILLRGESGEISQRLSKIESIFPQAERRLNEVKRMEKEACERS